MRRSTTIALLGLLTAAVVMAGVAHARRCTRARCRAPIAARCDGLTGVARKRCVRGLLRECRDDGCNCEKPGTPCGSCGGGFCGLSTDCNVPTCVQRIPFNCNTSDGSPLTCPGGLASCVFDDPLIGSYYCQRSLFAVTKCASPCP